MSDPVSPRAASAADVEPSRPGDPSTLQTEPPAPHRRRPGRRLAIGAGAVVGLLLLAWVTAALVLGDRVPWGTTVAGVGIGGEHPAAAEQRLTDELGTRAAAGLPVVAAEEQLSVEPASLGLGLDAPATVEAAGVGTWNPVTLVRGLLGARDVDPVASVDASTLEQGLVSLAEQVDRPVVEGDVAFAGAEVVTTQAVIGRELDRAAAGTVLREAFLAADEPVVLPVETVQPTVDAAEVERAVTEFAEPAVSGPVVLAAGDQQVPVPPETLGAVLSMDPDSEGVLQPVVDGAALVAAVTVPGAFQEEPRDARITLVAGAPVIEPSVAGRQVDAGQLTEALLPVLSQTGDRIVAVELAAKEAAFTTAQAEALGVVEPVSEFTTQYPDARYRRVNIGRAAELINGTLLKPGDTFSLNGVVGERTVANGFTTGTVIEGGKFVDGLGGGVSQVATTTFNAAFYAGLEDIQHKPHSVYISRYPVGREATVAWPSLDLAFRNDTPHGVLVEAVHTPGSSLTVRMWSTKNVEVTESRSERSNTRAAQRVYDTSADCQAQAPTNGFDITVYRTVTRAGQVVHDDAFLTKYNAADRIICGPDPARAAPPPAPPAVAPPPAAAG